LSPEAATDDCLYELWQVNSIEISSTKMATFSENGSDADDLRPEYDFRKLKGVVRGKYAASESIFLEIVLASADFKFAGRDEIEDPLDEALQKAQLGEVTGGGSGEDSSNIDVEVVDLHQGLTLIRRVLSDLRVAKSTYINQYDPEHVIHQIYE
jgi:hypothetical protein